MLMPRRIRHRKVQRGTMKGKAKGGTTLNFGSYGIQALEAHWITNRQIEAARVAMTRHMKRTGRVYITIFPDKPITRKPAETRMGKGKGNPEEWVAVVKPGRVMFEIDGVPRDVAYEALRLAIQKMPIKCKILEREDAEERSARVAEELAAKKAAKTKAAAAAGIMLDEYGEPIVESEGEEEAAEEAEEAVAESEEEVKEGENA